LAPIDGTLLQKAVHQEVREMTVNQIRGLKRHFVRHLDRLGKAIRRIRRMPVARRKKVELHLLRDLKREGRVIARIDKRYTRLARAA
jgi:hypothetical protein